MYNVTAVNLMNSKKNNSLISVLDNKKQIHIVKDQDESSTEINFPMNYWGNGAQKDDLTFFDLEMLMNS